MGVLLSGWRTTRPPASSPSPLERTRGELWSQAVGRPAQRAQPALPVTEVPAFRPEPINLVRQLRQVRPVLPVRKDHPGLLDLKDRRVSPVIRALPAPKAYQDQGAKRDWAAHPGPSGSPDLPVPQAPRDRPVR
jgi:hypothetical protein